MIIEMNHPDYLSRSSGNRKVHSISEPFKRSGMVGIYRCRLCGVSFNQTKCLCRDVRLSPQAKHDATGKRFREPRSRTQLGYNQDKTKGGPNRVV